MTLDLRQVEVAKSVCAQFIGSRRSSPRKELALLVRDGFILDEMENRSLIRSDKNRTEYFPTLGSFALLDDTDERLIAAHDGTVRVLHTLVGLYEARDASTLYTSDQLIEEVRLRDDTVDPLQIRLGLYLSVSEFGAIQTYKRSDDGLDILSVTIAEQVLKLTDPEASWSQRIALSRNNASDRPQRFVLQKETESPAFRSDDIRTQLVTFERTANLRFKGEVYELYEPAIQNNHELVEQYSKEGIAASMKFARRTADAVLAAFRTVEPIFKRTYIDPFAGRRLRPEMESRLREIVGEVMDREIARAQEVTRQLCSSFYGAASDRFSALVTRVAGTGAGLKERLDDAITVLSLGGASASRDRWVPLSEAPGPSVDETRSPRVFISYSWDSEEHKEWVQSFAARLRQDGVDVVLDEWHLDLGENRFHFMERSVVSAEFILLVCTPQYAEKANDREGGVGYESNIITSQIAERTDKKKFIPLLRTGNWKSALPVWLKHIVGCNLTANPYSEQEYKRLLRSLHRQQEPAPAVGPRPEFSQDEAPRESSEEALPPNLAPKFQFALKDELSVKERELLDAVINDPNGQINHRRPIGSEILISNGKSFIEQGKARSTAAWLGTLQALEQRGLIQPASAERHFYRATDQGYQVADRLGPFLRWKTCQILLEAHYMNAPTDSIEIKCSGVVEMPPVFYPEQRGADGSVMRSVKRHRSLLVEDIASGVLANTSWQPTDVSFLDVDTNEQKEFRVSMAEATEPGTLLLEMTS
jgi:hypothetical protein